MTNKERLENLILLKDSGYFCKCRKKYNPKDLTDMFRPIVHSRDCKGLERMLRQYELTKELLKANTSKS